MNQEVFESFYARTYLISKQQNKNSSVFCDIAPCRPVKVDRHFIGTCHLRHIGFLLGLLYRPEDEGLVFL
jgi:hypothetical protein